MQIAACYIRVSTDDQLEYSPDSQLKVILDYAAKNGYIIPEEYIFRDEGISGKRAKNRPEFNRMIALAKDKSKPFSCILLWKFSRFARNQEEAILYKNLLRKQGVDVKSVSEPVIEGAFGDLIERIIEWMDEFYVINLGQEVKRGMLEKASRGEVLGPAPFGYKNENKTYVPSADADVVRDIFESFISGEGQQSIARRLNAAGIKTKRGNPIDNRFVNYVLHNPVYTGKIRWSEEGRAASKRDYYNENILVSDGTHTPLISEETYLKAQEILKEYERRHKSYSRNSYEATYRLKGLIRCSSCGSTLCRATPKYLQCHRYAKGQCAISHHLSLELANAAIEEALEQAIATGNYNLKYKEPRKTTNVVDFKKMLEKEEHKLEKIREAYESGIDSLQEYAKRKEHIISNIATLKKEAKAQSSDSTTAEPNRAAFKKKLTSVLKTLRSPRFTEQQKNEALSQILEKAIYSKSTNTFQLFFYT